VEILTATVLTAREVPRKGEAPGAPRSGGSHGLRHSMADLYFPPSRAVSAVMDRTSRESARSSRCRPPSSPRGPQS
jgi:hypothetical protein